MATTFASIDEAAAIKRNSVHQTRLQLRLKQLEKDRSTRLRELSHDSQAFVKRLEYINSRRKSRTSLPVLTRAASAPPVLGCHRVGDQIEMLLSNFPQPREKNGKKVNVLDKFIETREQIRKGKTSRDIFRNATNPSATTIHPKHVRETLNSSHTNVPTKNNEIRTEINTNRRSKKVFRTKSAQKCSQEFLYSPITRLYLSTPKSLIQETPSVDAKGEAGSFNSRIEEKCVSENRDLSKFAMEYNSQHNKASRNGSKDATYDSKEVKVWQKNHAMSSQTSILTPSKKKVHFHVREKSAELHM